MSRLMLLVVFLTLSFAMLSQEDDEYLYMKDGIILGIKSELVEKCMGFMSDDITATEKEKEILCSCMMESLSKNYTYKEYMDLWEKDEAYLALFIADKNSSLYQDMMTCFRTKIEMLYPGAKFNTSMSKEVFMEECVKNVRNENLLYNYDVDELEFCNCVKDRVLSQGLAKLATGDIFDPNSLLHNEVYGPCLTIVDETSREQYTTVVNEATMNPSIPLLKYGTIYKVKVSF
ncbi:MAG: hypothetical protein U9R60_18410, partial [Bacteroidota bacterium]|nr:hypothetical protein [Bacteroidota bacterium]